MGLCNCVNSSICIAYQTIMRKIILIALMVCPMVMAAQTNLKDLRKKSLSTFAYKIAADSAEKYLNEDGIPVDRFLDEQPFYVFATDSIDELVLPKGHYVLINVQDNMVAAWIVGRSDLFVYAVNNQHRVQLEVRDKNGGSINNASVFVNKKAARYQPLAGNYLIPQRKPDEAYIKVYTPTDTIFTTLYADEVLDKTILGQRLNNFGKTRVGTTILWAPRYVSGLFKSRRYNYKTRHFAGSAGYMLFNQPKYKLTDTVHFKAFIVSKHHHPFKQPLNVYLEYYNRGTNKSQLLTQLNPKTAGAYDYAFALNDTMAYDISYNIVFRNKAGKQVLRNSFKTEDYIPDEISTYSLNASKETYYSNDTLQFTASAKDANGLSVLDGSIQFSLLNYSILDFSKDSVYVPDTVYTIRTTLSATEETVIKIPANVVPHATLSLVANCQFINANNEMHEEEKNIIYKPESNELVINQQKDSVTATNMQNGKSQQGEGYVELSGETSRRINITYPFSMKIDPFVTGYRFYHTVNGNKKDSIDFTLDNGYEVSLTRISIKDSVGFVLHNPNKIPVNYTVFDGNKIIATGKSVSEYIYWLAKPIHKNRMYQVKWQYVWNGDQVEKNQNIALLYKLLSIQINTNNTIYPGQKDSINIAVKDYKGKPAAHVNLTAAAYNAQLKKDVRVPEPPYLHKYKLRPMINYDTYEQDDVYITEKYALGKHEGWVNKAGLDSLLYYKVLLPKDGYQDVAIPVGEFLPQLSVFAVKNAIPQEIYLLYVNRKLVYYNGASEQGKYAFNCPQGYTQIGIRLKNQYIEIDSIYLQPNYKHDLFFDIEHLPLQTNTTSMPDTLTSNEKYLLQHCMLQLENNSINNNSYVWQNSSLVKLYKNERHLIGPFTKGDSLHFFAPGKFDMHFNFEPGYEYNISKQILRLEKKPVFGITKNDTKLPSIAAEWIMGDTIPSLPTITYPPAIVMPYLTITSTATLNMINGSGTLYIKIGRDSSIKYFVLQGIDTNATLVYNGSSQKINHIPVGKYRLLLVTNHFFVAEAENISIKSNNTLCVNLIKAVFEPENKLINDLIKEQTTKELDLLKISLKTPVQDAYTVLSNLPKAMAGNAMITGEITDKKGKNPIPGVAVLIKGTSTGTVSGADGKYTINHLKNSRYTLIISAVGYTTKELDINLNEQSQVTANAALDMSVQYLQEVVVTGYGTAKKRELTGSVISIREKELSFPFTTNNLLAGKVAGVTVNGNSGGSNRISIRGANTITGENAPLYIIDGIAYDQLPDFIRPEQLNDITVLKGAEATAIYGSRASNGVILIATKNKTVRTIFRDYAFWEPELETDKNGKAGFAVTYPDNITGWDIYVLAMDKKLRTGKSTLFIKSFKPLLAQQNLPSFLLEGDSSSIITKAFNYTNDSYGINTIFHTNKNQDRTDQKNIAAQSSIITPYNIIADNTDTIKTSFSLKTSTGFTDGEEKSIPVLKKGTEEYKGNFMVLIKDTAFSFTGDTTAATLNITATNNSIDLLLQELAHVKEYPYFCMEQTASKLQGLLMEQTINENLHKPSNNQKQIEQLIQKIQKEQLFDGGWSWWGGGKADYYITNYVINALLMLNKDPLVQNNIRNGLLFLQNNLSLFNKDVLLTSLCTMAAANHQMDYTPWIKTIQYDSLSQYQQWKYISLMQSLQIPHNTILEQITAKAINGILGDVHWGTDNYHWYNNNIATTIVAYKVLANEKDFAHMLPAIIQYFLSQRTNGYWRNTVESAAITNAILPFVLQQNNSFTDKASIQISGDSSITISKFPAQFSLDATKEWQCKKTGGGITYLSIYQHYWNNTPAAVTTHFSIESHFEKNKQTISTLQSGEKVNIEISLFAKEEADYVMLEIPIPAGCIYTAKTQDDWNIHKEFFKNKVVMFIPYLSKGKHVFSIPLETRFAGKFTINPATASLMYFPVLFGRNSSSSVTITPNQ